MKRVRGGEDEKLRWGEWRDDLNDRERKAGAFCF